MRSLWAVVGFSLLGCGDGGRHPKHRGGPDTGVADSDVGPGTGGSDTAAPRPRLSGQGELGEVSDGALVGPWPGAWLGYAVASGSDVSGDGLRDLVVGAPGPFTIGDERDGHVFVLALEGPRLAWEGSVDATATASLSGVGPGARAVGTRVGAGDVTGDGKADLVIDGGPFGERRWLRVLTGPVPGGDQQVDALATASIDLGVSYEHGTELVLRVDDVDQDGGTELLIGSWRSRIEGVDDDYTGAVFLITDPVVASGNVVELASTIVYGPGERVVGVGAAVSTGDVDGDGRRDLGVGTPSGDEGRYPGKVYGLVSVFLSEVPTGIVDVTTAEVQLHGGSRRSGIGAGLTLGGDFDGDGLVDIAAGGLGWAGDPERLGEVRVSRSPGAGEHRMTETSFATVVGNHEGRFGMVVEAAGDLDGDGFADLAVAGLGMVTVVYGPLSGSYVQDAPDAFGAEYPSGLIAVGDADGDGSSDLVVGDWASEDTVGAVHLLYGGLTSE